MLSKVFGAGIRGTEGFPVCCEADVESGFPQITFIGSLSASVRESADRVRTAIANSGIYLEPKHVTVNLSPADFRKEGCAYDLPVAVALLRAYELIPDTLLRDSLFAGELSLGGELLPVRGVISMVSAAKEAGLRRCFLPEENLREGSIISGIDCYGVSSLRELLSLLRGESPLPAPAVYEENADHADTMPDFSELCGQELVKRATLLAAGGRHNILYIGPAGSGKSMVASRLPSIMPEMSMEERLELSRIYSISGLLDPKEPLIRKRPFRSPHHSISAQALAGGGTRPRPGEISLASNGVLFLDELPEFRTEALEILRQPLEERCVHISRVYGSFSFPANFQLVCAMNPCKCGFWPDRSRCRCGEQSVRSYIGKISKPLLDRIDLSVEISPVDYAALRGSRKAKSSAELRLEVERVRELQERRFVHSGIRFNSEMSAAMLQEFCPLSEEDDRLLQQLYERGSMSVRGLHKILRVARTAADFDGESDICHRHVCEAVAYRSLDEKYWGGGSGESNKIQPPLQLEKNRRRRRPVWS